MEPYLHQEITEQIISACIEVHRHLGPGLLEKAYEECLCQEMQLRGMPFQRQVPLPINYKGYVLPCAYQMDLVVVEKVVVELKAVEELAPIHEAQILTYLRLSGHKVGLLINFNVPLLKNGIKRFVL